MTLIKSIQPINDKLIDIVYLAVDDNGCRFLTLEEFESIAKTGQEYFINTNPRNRFSLPDPNEGVTSKGSKNTQSI